MVRSGGSQLLEIMSSIGIKELLEAGVHFGHQTRRWNPKMKPFIFEPRNGIHIIDLSKTAGQLDAACTFLTETARRGGQILFVGTKKQAQEAVKEAAKTCGAHWSVERWLGGTLTNYQTVRRSIGRMKKIEQMEADGSITRYVKQEQSMIRRELARLKKNFDGIRNLEGMPAAMVVVDVKREHNCVNEARRLKIPLVAIVDTNCNPDQVDYPVAGNDDAIRSVRLLLSAFVQAVAAGKSEHEAKRSRRRTGEGDETAPSAPVSDAPPGVAPEPAQVLPATVGQHPEPAPTLPPEPRPMLATIPIDLAVPAPPAAA